MKFTTRSRKLWQGGALLLAVCAAFSSTPPIRAVQSGCATPSFNSFTSVTAGAAPRASVAGDFNLDGRVDLAVSSGNRIVLLFNNGNGSFTTNTANINGTAASIAAGDFNGDGRLDLLVGNDVGAPQLLLNNGAGGFPTSQFLPVPGNAPAVAVSDFNADGKLDVVAGTSTGQVVVVLGNGAGGFGEPQSYTTGQGVLAVLSGDFNLDGKPDVAALNQNNEGLAILFNGLNGASGLVGPVLYTIGIDDGRALTSGDFNGDGALDLAVANRASGRVSVQLNSGAGTFLQSQNFIAPALSLTTGDFNLDGKPDLALGGLQSSVEIRLGDGAGQFGNGFPFANGGRGLAVTAADLNADGRPDLAVVTDVPDAPDNLSLHLNACNAPPLNTPPVIVAGAALTRQQGAPAANDILATVNDAQTPRGKLSVYPLNLPAGISITNLVNNDGVISGDVSAACNAPTAALNVMLLVVNASGLAATAELRINVTPNAPPALGSYTNAAANLGAGATRSPAEPPSDNFAVISVTAAASAGFTGALNVNPNTGAVTITNAAPVGTHTITVTALDNCNAAATQSFTLTVSTPSCLNTRPGLLSWYRGEGNALDWQNNNNGAGVGGLTFAAGRVGQALSFNGASELVIPHSPALNFQQFTFEGWVFPTLLDGAVEFILNKEDEPFTTYHYEWGIAGTGGTIPVGTLVFALNGLNGLPNEFGGFISGGGTVPLNAWTHVALSFDGTTIKSYLNGTVARTLTGLSGNLITSTGPLKIGSRSNTLIAQLPANRFNGLIDELSLYTRALSDAELRAIYNAGIAGKCTRFVNTAPTITAGAALTQQRGNSGTVAQLATVNDNDTAPSDLSVTVANAPEGLSFGKITNTNGVITAPINVGCDVALGANAVTLRVSDGDLSSTAVFTVNVTANTPPVLSAYTSPGNLPTGQSVTVTPAAAPSDNGTLTSVLASVSGAFAGSVTVVPATGVVTLGNVRPPGTYTATVTATDNCGATATTSFVFTVTKLASTVTLSAGNEPVAQGEAFTLTATAASATPNVTAPGGTVNFFDGNTALGAATLDNAGVARLRVTLSEAGPRALTASYAGDALYLGATSTPLGLPVAFAVTNVSAANYRAAALAPEQVVAAFGTRLATTSVAATSVPLPTLLGGTVVRVRDNTGLELPAPLFFVSPTQINYVLPSGLALGPATITIINSDGVNSLAHVQLAATNPGLFTVDASGRGLPAAQALRVLPNGEQRFEAIARFDAATNKFVAVPIELGPANETVFLILFGTGMRGRGNALTTASVGSAVADVVFLGAAPGLTGVDQVNLRLPRSLVGAGDVEVNLLMDGKAANPVRVTLR